MDVLADFLSVAGVVAHLGRPLLGDRSWKHEVVPTSASATKSGASGKLVFYAVAHGQIRFASHDADHSLDGGDAIFVLEGHEHRIESCSDGLSMMTAQIEFTSGSIGLSSLGLSPTIAGFARDDSHTSDLVHRLAKEIQEERGGWQSVSLGIVNALFIAALRAGGTGAQPGNPSSNHGGNGWLRGMADAEIGAALQLMHANPEYRWTVAELANELAVSRSAFAARFKKMTGRPPLEYLTWWRLQRAAERLRSGDATVADVARVSGYQSEAAFGKAFRREFGISPGQLRRQAQASSHTPSQLQRELKKRDPFAVPEQEVSLNLMKTAEWMREPFISLMDSPLLTLHRRQLSHLSEGELAELNRLLVKARDPAS